MHIVFLTGAGMSAESGVPTFRDALTGLWAHFDPGELATPAAFARDPDLVWGWYRWRANAVRKAEPHAGHRGIAALEGEGHAVTVVTQNVDDLHERAGSTHVLHLHGRLFASRCAACACAPASEPLASLMPSIGSEAEAKTEGREAPPRCTHCGGRVRPGVVWFGEALPDAEWQAAQDAIAACDLVVVVGTSGLVFPAAGLPATARAAGKRVLDINPDDTPIAAFAHRSWRMPASTGIQRLTERLRTNECL